jgi:hypothetical protein
MKNITLGILILTVAFSAPAPVIYGKEKVKKEVLQTNSIPSLRSKPTPSPTPKPPPKKEKAEAGVKGTLNSIQAWSDDFFDGVFDQGSV